MATTTELEPASATPRAALRIEGVDALRGIAALLVVFFHGPEVEGVLRPLRPLQTIGFSGVGLFLVLSGFSIHYRWAESGQDGHFAQRRFWRRRLRRLLPTYWAALALAVVATVIIGAVSPVGNVPWVLAGGTMPAAVALLGQAMLVFANIVPLPYVGVAWSLALEIHLYAIYSLFISRLRSIGVLRIVVASLIVAVAWRVGAEIVTTSVPVGQFKPDGRADSLSRIFYSQVPARWFEWMLGLLVAEAYFGNVPTPRLLRSLPVSLFVLLVSAVLFRMQIGEVSLNGHPFFASDVFLDQLFGVGYAGVLVWAVGRSKVAIGQVSILLRPLAWVGLFSYSLYLTHGVAIALVAKTIPTAPNLVLVLASISASLVVAYVTYLLVERRFVRSTPLKRLR